MNNVLKSYYAHGGQASRKKVLDAYRKYIGSYSYDTGVKFNGSRLHGWGSNLGFEGGKWNFGNIGDISDNDIMGLGSDIVAGVQSSRSYNADPTLGKNHTSANPGSYIASQMGSMTADILRAIDAATYQKHKDPLRQIGVRACGGKLHATGGEVMNAFGSTAKLIGNAIGQSKLDMYSEDFNKAMDAYENSALNSLYNINDNSGLLQSYENISYVPETLKAENFRDKSVLADFTDGLAASFEGFNAGSSFGPIGAVVGGIFGGVSSNIGSIAGRVNAKAAARAGNKRIGQYNQRLDLERAKAADRVDMLNDRKLLKNYMDLNALGGPLSTHGSDFDNGLIFIDAGGSHEQNPLGGVPAGVDENGTPDLVEQNEVIWQDYVFSDRLAVPEDLHKKYKLKEGSTFADAVRKLTETSLERPNSPIDKETNNAILSELRERQEEERGTMQAQNAMQLQQAIQQDQDLISLALQENGYPAMQQQAPIEMPPAQEAPAYGEPEGFALGGNLFYPGGYLWWDNLGSWYPREPEAPAVEASAEEVVGVSPVTTGSTLTTPTGHSYGTWKEGNNASNWLNFSRSGVEGYIKRQAKAYSEAKTPEDKQRIQQDTIDTINLVQTGYGISYNRFNGKPRSTSNAVVRAHQTNWNKIGGNSGFTNILAAQNLPNGHLGNDTAEKGWVDGLWGPQTSIRHMGSSENSVEDLKSIIEGLNGMGIDYSPSLAYGNEGNKLYLASLRQADNASTPQFSGRVPLNGLAGILDTNGLFGNVPPVQSGSKPSGEQGGAADTPSGSGKNTTPQFDPRKAAIYGTGLAALNGILGTPDYTNADAILAAAEEMGTPLNIPVELLGDYRRRRPFDERYLVNLANARHAAAIRSGMNTSGGNRAMQMSLASTLAHDNQGSLAEIMRQAYLANRADDAQVAEFNRGTNQFNASSINQRNHSQAGLNTQRLAQALSGKITGRRLRQNIKDVWDATTAQNITNFLNNLGLYGKEKAGNDMLYSMGEQGYFPYMYDNMGQGFNLNFGNWKYNPVTGEPIKACGGQLKKKRRF